MQTVLRTRPLTEQEQEAGAPSVTVIDSQNVIFHPRIKHGRQGADMKYSFTQVFDEHSSQEEVYINTAMPPLRDLLQMRSNGLVFTLGVTNSGKTYTMAGSGSEIGIVPRCTASLFRSLRSNLAPRHTFKIHDQTRIPYVQVGQLQ